MIKPTENLNLIIQNNFWEFSFLDYNLMTINLDFVVQKLVMLELQASEKLCLLLV
jgi:hypothetical protein